MEKQTVIRTLPEALRMIKEMNLTSRDEWAGEYREQARSTVAKVLKDQMEERVAGHLSWAYQKGIPDRRNGSYLRHVLTELGNVVLQVPRTRLFSPRGIIAAYARRVREIDHLILACFLLGLSTRKVGIALCSILREKISPQTVSRVARTLDHAVRAFHRRRITTHFRALILDGIVIKRKIAGGTLSRPVLVALGIRDDGKKEVIDFHLAKSESGPEWRRFLTDLLNRGLTESRIEVICADGGPGLISILPEVYPSIPLQRCWAHKVRNILDKVPKKKEEPSREAYGRSTRPIRWPRQRRTPIDGYGPGRSSTRRRSNAFRMTWTICSPVFNGKIPNSGRRSAQPTRLNDGSGKYGEGPGLWVSSAIKQALRESFMVSS